VAKGVAAAGFQTGVPIVFGVLTTDTLQQALERAGIKANHGWDYAMSALEMASLMSQIHSVNGNLPHHGAVQPGRILTGQPPTVLTPEADL
jgi:6,7-dimethyl-8-ribityllumazine synthase